MSRSWDAGRVRRSCRGPWSGASGPSAGSRALALGVVTGSRSTSREERSLTEHVSSAAAPACTVVVVSYQSAADLPAALSSLPAAAGDAGLEVVVVDNASSDGSASIAAAHGARVIESGGNVGYARAANVGAFAGAAPWVLVLNPDTTLDPGSLQRLLGTGRSDAHIGAVGPHLRNPDGSDYPTGRRFPSMLLGLGHALLAPVWPDNPATRWYHMADARRAAPMDVDWLSGACLLVRRSALESVGGFDERYFMYGEDMDLCLQLHRAAWRVVYDPGARVMHRVGGSTRTAPYRKVIDHHGGVFRFYLHRFARDPRVLLAPAVGAFLAVRAGVSLVQVGVRELRRPADGPQPSEAR